VITMTVPVPPDVDPADTARDVLGELRALVNLLGVTQSPRT